MEKLNVTRCGGVGEGKPPRWFALPDEAACHLWSSEPSIEITDCGPVAWWVCGRCPARVLHDCETEDGFPLEPIVVYPPSCFGPQCPWRGVQHPIPSPRGCGCSRKASDDVVHLNGCVEAEPPRLGEGAFARLVREQAARTFAADADDGDVERLGAARTDPIRVAMERAPEVEWLTPEQRAESDCIALHGPPVVGVDCSTCGIGFAGTVAPRTCPACGAVQPADTEPAPPSRELARSIDCRAVVIRQLMEDTGWTAAEAERELDEHHRLNVIEEVDEDNIPTSRYPVHIESAGIEDAFRPSER